MVGKTFPAYTKNLVGAKIDNSICLQMDADRYETARELFSYLDYEQKGFIAVEELSVLGSIGGEFTESQLYSVFSVLDKEGSGKITLQDFTEAFVTLGNLSNAGDYHNTEEEHGLSTPIDCPKADLWNQENQDTIHDEIPGVGLMTGNELNLTAGNFTDTANLQPGSKTCGEVGERDENIEPSKTDHVVVHVDDIFEGEGQLLLDVQSLSASPTARSPLRAPKTRSPSLRRRFGSSLDCDIRLPPDGGEGNNSIQSSPKTSQLQKKDSNKQVASSQDIQTTGFAKSAINDLLKIVDSHTLSNLGVYGNERGGVWRHDVNWNVQDCSTHVLSDDRKCPPWLRVSQDWTENGARSRSEGMESKLTSDLCRTDSDLTSNFGEMESTSSDYCSNPECKAKNSFKPINSEADLNSMCDCENSNSNRSMFSPTGFSESSPTDSLSNFDCVRTALSPDQIDANSINGNQKMQVGASVDTNVVGNLIFDTAEENNAQIYDRILSYSGVELNSRVSSSETSLHELLLEAEAVRNKVSLIEDWDLVIKRINGVSVFGG